MLKKIQYNLLIKKPLLWNIKIVPLTLILVIINLLFLIIGYANGSIDFTETDNNYRSNNDDSIVFFAVLISLITSILWVRLLF